ncbi:ATP-dependent zinc metalloprotease FTSH 2-chloroplastic [Striga hermonthica]|uniref:ATP-dependent zinc metalloprotease FTSH, chloroplastic n=1 Tax=Striga hermonthica TaxID=68872 RepID=A0A9N7MFE8_STRHE|nr:ATP-dependent zinc metalloprotease FTSH 2-chloroplastic [Striga hermonthica]
MSYSRFLEYLDKDRVKKVDLFENGTISIVEAFSPELGNRAQKDSGNLLFNLIGNLAFPLLLIGGLFLLSRRSSGGMGGPGGAGFALAFGQSKVKFQMEPNTGFTFDDVAGVDEAKQDFMEVVEFLKKPERLGLVSQKEFFSWARPVRGKPCCPRQLPVRPGSPFSPSRRGTGIGAGNDEREQMLNQLLTEMDGFEGNTGIIVIAATHRVDILDSALLRPGRFDRQVTVDVPDIRGRTEILKVHAGNKKFDSDVSLEVIAMRTLGFSRADLANLLNEAAILAGRCGKTAISSKEIDYSIDRIVAGMEGTVMTDGKSKSLVAYHEVGHAICG